MATSGYLGTAPDGSGLVSGGFAAETRQALDNIKAVLEAAGCAMTDVIRVNVSLTDINRFAEMDAIYCEYFSEPYPTRNTIGVKELWGGAQVGFDVWAVIDTRRKLMSAILEHIQDHEAIELTKQLIRIPSFLWRESAIGRWLADWMSQRGYEVELQEVPLRDGSVTHQAIGVLRGDGGGSLADALRPHRYQRLEWRCIPARPMDLRSLRRGD